MDDLLWKHPGVFVSNHIDRKHPDVFLTDLVYIAIEWVVCKNTRMFLQQMHL